MNEYWHSVILDKDLCCGCTNCLDRCPTQAIRVIEGKARIIKERCIDCGECIRVCPYYAKGALTDNLSKLNKFKYKIAIPAISIYGQFPTNFDMDKIFETFKMIGFDDVFDTSHGADIVTAAQNGFIDSDDIQRPLISTLCPAIVRLIQIRYPSLLDNIVPVETPMEVSARLAKKLAMEKTGLSETEIGVFYITQCPAKITSIYNPIGIKDSALNGAVSLRSIFSKMLKTYEDVENSENYVNGSGYGIGWGRVGGQSYALSLDNYLAVDGIEEVIKILDKIELGKLPEIDFFEGYACVTGCCGGPLNVENPFVAKSRIRKMAKNSVIERDFEQLEASYEEANITWDGDIKPLAVMKLDGDFKKAMEKMATIEKLYKELPQIDCGACGSPTCKSLAEDIVMGRATMSDCIVKNNKEK